MAGDDAVPSGDDGCLCSAAHTLIEMAGAATIAGDLVLYLVEAAPGSGFPRHVHTREDEFLFVLDGAFEWLVGGRRRHGGRGAFAAIPRGTVHQVRCRTGQPGRALVCFTRPGVDVLVREVEHRPVDGAPVPAPDASRLACADAAARRYGWRIVAWNG